MNKKLLLKGLKQLMYTIFLAFTGPVVLTSAFNNQHHPFYIPVLIAAIILCLGAIGVGFAGIRNIVKGLFNEN